MDEFQIIQKQMQEIKNENRWLRITHPLACVNFSSLLFLTGVATKSISVQMLGLSLTMLSLMNWKQKSNIENQIQQNNADYFYKAVDLNFAIQEEISKRMNAISQEKDKNVRNGLIRDILRIKKENLIRQKDKKALFGLSGRKRRGLARGLRNLRHHMKYMTFNEYVKCRENILSYY